MWAWDWGSSKNIEADESTQEGKQSKPTSFNFLGIGFGGGGVSAEQLESYVVPKDLEGQFDVQQIGHFRRIFAAFDADGSGALSRDEFVRGWLAAFKPSSDAVEVCGEAQADAEAEAHARFDAIDTQGDGTIDALEWTQSLPLEVLLSGRP